MKESRGFKIKIYKHLYVFKQFNIDKKNFGV